MLHRIVSQILICTLGLIWMSVIATAQYKGPIEWYITNDNRVFESHDAQFEFLTEFCRARHCALYAAQQGRPPAGKDLAAYCERISFNKSCSAFDRSKPLTIFEQKMSLWSPLPKSIKTQWDEASAQYKPNYVHEGKRRIKISIRERDLRVDLVCAWTLLGGNIPLSKSGTCDEQFLDVDLDRTYQLKVSVTSPSGTIPEALKSVEPRTIRARDIVVLALGDSYSSGEGNPHWFANFSGRGNEQYKSDLDQWWDRRCHRSLFSYPVMATTVASVQARYPVGDSMHSFTLLDYACSGAEITKSKAVSGPAAHPFYSGGILSQYEGRETKQQVRAFATRFGIDLPAQHTGDPIPAQIDRAEDAMCTQKSGGSCTSLRKADYIVTTIGGNDVGFGTVLLELIAGCGAEKKADCATRMLDARFKELFGNDGLGGHFRLMIDKLQKFRRKLAEGEKPATPIIFMQYPDLTSASKGGQVCDDLNFNRILAPVYVKSVIENPGIFGNLELSSFAVQWFKGRNYRVNTRDAKWAYTHILKRLNSSLESAAEKYPKSLGLELLGGIEKMSKGRGWWKVPSWFITFEESAEKIGSLVDDEGRRVAATTTGIAHPNIFGHDFIAWRLRCRFAKDSLIKKDNVFESKFGGSCQ